MKFFTRFVLIFSLAITPIAFHVAIQNAFDPKDNGRFWFCVMVLVSSGLLFVQSAIAMLSERKEK